MTRQLLLLVAFGLAMQACHEGVDAPTAAVIASGTCGAQGDNLAWTLTDDGTLTISGKGQMADFVEEDPSWGSHAGDIQAVVLQDGVTSIGNYAFYHYASLASVSIPGSVASVGYYSFSECTDLASVTIPEGVARIEEGTFTGCSRLASVSIPGSVTGIGDWAFED